MDKIDVTELLTDPELADLRDLVCYRAVESIGNDGRSSTEREPIPFAGVVTPDKSRVLGVMEDGTRITGAIKIVTTFELDAGGAKISPVDSGNSSVNDVRAKAPDWVSWRGRRYTVDRVDDYSNFGFVRAFATIREVT